MTKAATNKKDFSALLKGSDLKVTPGRIAILEFFAKHGKPVSAEEVFAGLKNSRKGKGKAIDQVTVYRTLASFEKAGIIKQVNLRTGAVLYEMPRHHHHHLVCVECGLIEDIDMCGIEDASKKILKQSKKFSSIKDHSLELFGVCAECAKA